ncbi:MAG: response regulator [Chloroflexota bacterium]|nr:response regulator [Chloroflexota bacterium]
MARILIIDDSYDMLELLKAILVQDGKHQVSLSPNGKDGLAQALKEHPDLAIVDVMMPEMNGYEVVRRLRAEPSTANMGIIILTARGQAVDKTAALEAGADHYMSKPVDAQELIDTVTNTLNVPQVPTESAIYPVFSLRGGVGATTLAVNLALLLQQLSTTVLIDLSPNSGHCAPYLGLRPQYHWGMLIQENTAKNIDSSIGSLTLKHSSGLRLLAAPPTPTPVEQLTSGGTELLLTVLQRYLRFIVVDMPPVINTVSTLLLEKASKVILVSGSDSPSLQTTLHTLKALQEHRDKLVLVLNNVAPGRQLPLAAVQRALHMPVTVQIPYHAPEVATKQAGAPAVPSQPKSPVVVNLQRVVRILLHK